MGGRGGLNFSFKMSKIVAIAFASSISRGLRKFETRTPLAEMNSLMAFISMFSKSGVVWVCFEVEVEAA